MLRQQTTNHQFSDPASLTATPEQLTNWPQRTLVLERNGTDTGKSFLEALILELTNPQYDKRLFNEFRVQYMKIQSSELVDNLLCAQIVVCINCFLF